MFSGNTLTHGVRDIRFDGIPISCISRLSAGNTKYYVIDRLIKVAMLAGILCTLSMIVIFLAGTANAQPAAILQIKWLLASVVLVQLWPWDRQLDC